MGKKNRQQSPVKEKATHEVTETEMAAIRNICSFKENMQRMDFTHEGMTNSAVLWRDLSKDLSMRNYRLLCDAWGHLTCEQDEAAFAVFGDACDEVIDRITSGAES